MNSRFTLFMIAVCAVASGAVAQAQSLPDIAKAEKERRAKLRAISGPAKVHTDGSASGSAGETTGQDAETSALAPAAAGPESAAKKPKEKSSQELSTEKQQEWLERRKKAQDEIKALEEVIARNERSLASMFNITPARADMAAAIASDKEKLGALKKTLVDLEDERRRAGLPRPR